jgi:uncharacterized protein with HEPN domain
MDEIYKSIGELSIIYTRVEFAMSFINSYIQNLNKPELLFNQKITVDNKIKLARKVLKSTNVPDEIKSEISKWLTNFKKLKNIRNTIIHNYVLDNNDGFVEFVEFNKTNRVKTIKLLNVDEVHKTIKSLNGLISHSIVILLKLEKVRKVLNEE